MCYSSLIIWDLGGVWVILFKYLNTLFGSEKAKIKVANLARRQRVIGPRRGVRGGIGIFI